MAIRWQEGIAEVSKHVVRISTPDGSGTGFLFSKSEKVPIWGIATAAHVIDHAHYWEQPIRIDHYASGKTLLLRAKDRAIFLKEENDTGVIVANKGDLPFPEKTLEITPEKKSLKVGAEVGWLGFPAIRPSGGNLCFFSGRVSFYDHKNHYYLVDGVAINGVSGGPTFFLSESAEKPVIIGVVSAYIVNRATGETLPGLSMVQDVMQFQELIKEFKSLDEAKENEAAKEPPPPNPENPGARKSEGV